jgi:lipopolysaccharide/colanic/teichoic acid biosynthesis glycosyltransferase
MSDWRGLLKRLFDIVLVLGALPLLTPLLILVAVAIRAESSGPVLFRQWRFGLGSKPTQIIKFRTMYHDRGDSTGEQRTVAYDPRVTMVGRILRRTSIDELPQLLNVLRGEMSLVGPRPHATHMKVDGNYYFEAVRGYRFRHRVKPGITGWAQITGSRGEVDTIDKALERVEKDLWYVRNWSLALDLRILMLTVLGKFASPGAD